MTLSIGSVSSVSNGAGNAPPPQDPYPQGLKSRNTLLMKSTSS
jgi:hypothetical protein